MQLTWHSRLHPSSTLTCGEGMRSSEQYLVPSRHCSGPTSTLRSSSMDATEGDLSACKHQRSADKEEQCSQPQPVQAAQVVCQKVQCIII